MYVHMNDRALPRLPPSVCHHPKNASWWTHHWTRQPYSYCFRQWTEVITGTLICLQLRKPIRNRVWWCTVCCDTFLSWSTITFCMTYATEVVLSVLGPLVVNLQHWWYKWHNLALFKITQNFIPAYFLLHPAHWLQELRTILSIQILICDLIKRWLTIVAPYVTGLCVSAHQCIQV